MFVFAHRLATLAFCGSYGGAVLGMPISGILADKVGWYAPYYFYGVCGVCWYACWLWLAFEKPSKHPSISPREQYYIEQVWVIFLAKKTYSTMYFFPSSEHW